MGTNRFMGSLVQLLPSISGCGLERCAKKAYAASVFRFMPGPLSESYLKYLKAPTEENADKLRVQIVERASGLFENRAPLWRWRASEIFNRGIRTLLEQNPAVAEMLVLDGMTMRYRLLDEKIGKWSKNGGACKAEQAYKKAMLDFSPSSIEYKYRIKCQNPEFGRLQMNVQGLEQHLN
ncbi:Uncharacterised protein [uncultured archaeon]|nr:Uncharacterised protein [uncultured archaeon]